MSLHPAKHSKRPRLNANAHRRVHHDILPSHLRARRSRAHPPNAPNTAHSRRSVPCITCVFEWSIGLLVAQSSSLFAHPASQPPGAQTAPRRPTRPRELHLRARHHKRRSVPPRSRICVTSALAGLVRHDRVDDEHGIFIVSIPVHDSGRRKLEPLSKIFNPVCN